MDIIGHLYLLTALTREKQIPLGFRIGQDALEKGGVSRPCRKYKNLKFRPIVRCIYERLLLYFSITKATVPAISTQSAVFDLR